MRKVATPWLWPASKRGDDAFGVRLGRLVHWVFVAFASCVITAGLWFTLSSYAEHRAALRDGSQWDRNHHLADQTGKVKVASITAAGDKIPPPPDGSSIDWQPGDDNRPDEVPVRPNGALLGICAGLVLALIGRGVRYLVGNE